MNDTKIEWVDKTINPVVGCTGFCHYCYAAGIFDRFKGTAYKGQKSFHEPTFYPERLEQIKKLRNARRPYSVFLNSMSDVADWDVEWFDALSRACGEANTGKYEHDFIVLTKRPEEFLQNVIIRAEEELHGGFSVYTPFLHIGITACTQGDLDERVPHLLQIPAKSHFVSLEPLMGAVRFDRRIVMCHAYPMTPQQGWNGAGERLFKCEHPDCCCRISGNSTEVRFEYDSLFLQKRWGSNGAEIRRIDAVIVGGMTGRNATPMHPDWVRSIRDQCEEAGVPFFFKSWGDWMPVPSRHNYEGRVQMWTDDVKMLCTGKKHSGRELDGRTHDDLPWMIEGVR